MASVRFRLPRMLAPFADDRRNITLDAITVSEALATLKNRYPMLRTHLQDEAGNQRPHVSIFYNDTDIRRMGSLDGPVHDGDEIIVLQAISGGRPA